MSSCVSRWQTEHIEKSDNFVVNGLIFVRAEGFTKVLLRIYQRFHWDLDLTGGLQARNFRHRFLENGGTAAKTVLVRLRNASKDNKFKF